ncbi:MAG: hypothetical protein O6846_01630, partial [Thaumarchaeota archaeon]|nr:hypothetical protein [Nitrososphaerota archaeon]
MKRELALLFLLLMTIPFGPQIIPSESLGQKWNDSIAGSYVFDRCISCENTYHNNTKGQVNVTLTNIDPFSQTILINTIELSFIWINLDTTVLRGTNFTRLDVDNSSTWTFDFNIPGTVKTEDDHQFQFRVFYRVLSRVALGAELDVRSPTDHIRITDIEQVTSDATLAKALVKLKEVNQTTYGSPVARDLVRDAQKAYDLGLLFFNNTRWHNATQHANIVLDLLDKIPAAEKKYTDEIIASMKSRLEGVDLDLYGSIEAKDFFARA